MKQANKSALYSNVLYSNFDSKIERSRWSLHCSQYIPFVALLRPPYLHKVLCKILYRGFVAFNFAIEERPQNSSILSTYKLAIVCFKCILFKYIKPFIDGDLKFSPQKNVLLRLTKLMSTVETFDDNNNNKNINHTQITPTELSSITLTTRL